MSSLKPIIDKIDELKENLSKSDRPISFRKACEYLDVSKSQLYKLVHFKKLAYYKPNGKMLYFKEYELKEWLFKNRIKTKDELQNEVTNNIFSRGK